MNIYDPTELIALCQSIIEDGEISGAELYQLSEWLNNNREACFSWPGNLLVKPLQELWADGKATTTEMRKMGRLLLKIQKDAVFERAVDFVSESAPAFDLSQPQLPAIPFITKVKSQSDKSVFYDVDLGGPTCSCPDWHNRRHLPRGHLTRCCKHVLSAYQNLDCEEHWSGWLGAFIGSAYPPHPQQEWMVIQIGNDWVLASTAPSGWANVFAPAENEYDRFGYNVLERRWSYGTEPTGSERIARAISAATP